MAFVPPKRKVAGQVGHEKSLSDKLKTIDLRRETWFDPKQRPEPTIAKQESQSPKQTALSPVMSVENAKGDEQNASVVSPNPGTESHVEDRPPTTDGNPFHVLNSHLQEEECYFSPRNSVSETPRAAWNESPHQATTVSQPMDASSECCDLAAPPVLLYSTLATTSNYNANNCILDPPPATEDHTGDNDEKSNKTSPAEMEPTYRINSERSTPVQSKSQGELGMLPVDNKNVSGATGNPANKAWSSAKHPQTTPTNHTKSPHSSVSSQSASVNFVRPDTHFCPACKDLMYGPSVTPMFLIPCGHQLCRKCCENQARGNCPWCRQPVKCFTTNYMLQSLIDISETQRSFCVSQQHLLGQGKEVAVGKDVGEWAHNLAHLELQLHQLDTEMQVLNNEIDGIRQKLNQEEKHWLDMKSEEADLLVKKREIEQRLGEIQAKGLKRHQSRQVLQTEIQLKHQRLEMLQDYVKSMWDKINKLKNL